MHSDDVDEVYPEGKLLSFLTLVTKLLNSSGSDIDTICKQVEACHNFEDGHGSNINQDSAILRGRELKNVLFSDEELIPSLEIAIKSLLEMLLHQIQNDNGDKLVYKSIVNVTAQICRFLEVSEKHISSSRIKRYVSEFLISLIEMLGSGDTPTFNKNGPLCLLVTRVLGVFKEAEFARKLVVCELLKKLKMFHNFMVKFTNDNELYTTPCYENLMLNLSVLKEMLAQELLTSELRPAKRTKKGDSVYVNLSLVLSKISEILPGYIQLLAQECLNLIL